LQILKPALGGILSKDPEFPTEIDQIIANATDADRVIQPILFGCAGSWKPAKILSRKMNIAAR
jgi:hypothetical protein